MLEVGSVFIWECQRFRHAVQGQCQRRGYGTDPLYVGGCADRAQPVDCPLDAGVGETAGGDSWQSVPVMGEAAGHGRCFRTGHLLMARRPRRDDRLRCHRALAIPALSLRAPLGGKANRWLAVGDAPVHLNSTLGEFPQSCGAGGVGYRQGDDGCFVALGVAARQKIVVGHAGIFVRQGPSGYGFLGPVSPFLAPLGTLRSSLNAPSRPVSWCLISGPCDDAGMRGVELPAGSVAERSSWKRPAW